MKRTKNIYEDSRIPFGPILVVAIVLLVAAIGFVCGVFDAHAETVQISGIEYIGSTSTHNVTFPDVYKYYDHDNGVVCYTVWMHGTGISCFKN